MDLTINNPNIFTYDILNKYIEDKVNYEYFKNLYLIDGNYHINTIKNINSINYSNNEKSTNNYADYDNNNNNIDNDFDNNSNSTDHEDVWETVINDEKFYINNKIARIFPVLKNFNNYSKIKIDEDSFCYITIREIAEIISKIICYHLLEYNLNPQKSTIIDYTAGVGGNILSFSKYFKSIYAIELDELRADYLKNNIGVYGYKNITVINKCAIEFNNMDLITLNPNVVFVDPPWGGSNYKNNENLTLSLGNIQMEELVIDIVKKFSEHYTKIVELNPKENNNNYNNKFIILKLPKNYNIEYFYNHIKSNNNFPNYNICLYLYILNKMIVIVCELQYKFY